MLYCTVCEYTASGWYSGNLESLACLTCPGTPGDQDRLRRGLRGAQEGS